LGGVVTGGVVGDDGVTLGEAEGDGAVEMGTLGAGAPVSVDLPESHPAANRTATATVVAVVRAFRIALLSPVR
jgi:hypothetical protein